MSDPVNVRGQRTSRLPRVTYRQHRGTCPRASLAMTAAGFLLFWLAGLPVAATAGLFLCGPGIANLYPLSLALALTTARGSGDTANARTQLLGALLLVAGLRLGRHGQHP